MFHESMHQKHLQQCPPPFIYLQWRQTQPHQLNLPDLFPDCPG
jgi:hypothetical protein